MSTTYPDPDRSAHVRHNPTFEELRQLSAHLETTTEYDSPSYVSEYRSRSAAFTKNTVDDTFTAEDWDQIERAREYVRDTDLVCVDRQLGRDPENSFVCRLYVPAEHARIALGWAKLLEPATGEPDFVTVQLPDWDDLAIRVLVEEGETFVLGSDYTGEAKKSFLRLFMYEAKRHGGLGLHAGSKRVTLVDTDDLRTVGQVFLGLSATGKSTLTGHGFWLEHPESAAMLQDDVCALYPDGAVYGSEGNGLYIKTIGLSADGEPELYHAATQSGAVLENVGVAEDGTVDFEDDQHTTNTRAVVLREDLASAAEDIDLESVDQVFFITRNPLMPPVARLDDAQAAAAFMLGESIQTSAGDPSRAGEHIRVVGTNPFIIGSEGEEGNRFQELVADLDLECFVINTGYVGDRDHDIGVSETVSVLTAIARGDVEWGFDDAMGLDLPTAVPGVDIEHFHPPSVIDDFEKRYADLKAERRAYLEQFDTLDGSIVDATY